MKAYKHCIYDKFNKNILIRYVGDTKFTKIPYVKDYYVKDPSGKSEIKDIYGTPMIRKTNYDKDAIQLLKDSKVTVAESDLKEEVKYMHSVYDNEELNANIDDWNICFFDIEISVESEFPKPDLAAYPINLITCYSTKTKQTYTWGLEPYTGNSPEVTNYKSFKTELELLKDWIIWFNTQNFDIWTGWNSELFDVPYIVNRIKNVREQNNIKTQYELALSPVNKKLNMYDVLGADKSVIGHSYEIPGLIHFDYMNLYDKFASHGPLDAKSLNYISNLELNEGKLEYEGTINTIYKTDWNKFVEYNIQDVMLLVKLENKKQVFPMIITYAYDSLVTLDKIYNKVPTTEGYILKFIHKRNQVMNDRNIEHIDWWREEECYKLMKDGEEYLQNVNWETGETTFKPFGIKAGYCYDYPGRYDNCMSFDITSSYPHHMMQFNISPEVKVIHPTKEQIESGEVIPSDIAEVGFKRTNDAILPSLVKQIFNERKHYKKLMKEAEERGDKDAASRYDALQLTKKLVINSVYGVSLNSGYHLYDIDCARSITRCARVTLRDWLSKYLNEYYVNKAFVKELESQMSVVILNTEEGKKVFYDNEEITVLRNNEEKVIKASEFNAETDLLGI